MGAKRAALICLSLLALLALYGTWWLDTSQPQAGAWALIGLSVSLGVLHGALDAPLLQRRFTNRWALLQALTLYLAAVLLLGWLLSGAIVIALWALIAMSIWHFGEGYARWDDLPSWSGHLTRAVVGGAPIMLPVWLAPSELTLLLAPVVEAAALQVWRVGAVVWSVLLVVWVVACGVSRPAAARHAWFELIGCAAAYLVFSPVMAFALYFGVYHAPVHIWRVWRAWSAGGAADRTVIPPSPSPVEVVAALAATLIATWLLGAALWWLLSANGLVMPDTSSALRWLIVGLAAVTAPHLVLISFCSDFLSRKGGDEAAKRQRESA